MSLLTTTEASVLCRFNHSRRLVSNQGNRLTRSLLVGAMALGATLVPLGQSPWGSRRSCRAASCGW